MSRTLLSHFENKYVDSSRALGYTGILTINRKEKMTELEKLKKLLVSAHDELRARKQKNTPTFGAMMFMLQAIVQCNAALNERKKYGNDILQKEKN